jgi:putative Mn2+ efflux pump MntP
MFLSLTALGFILSLDNFRTAITLGPLRFPWRHALKIAVAFGFFDGAAPLVGILVGHAAGHLGGETTDRVGAAALALYGLYLIVRALQTGAQEELQAEHGLSIFGLPVSSSLDNLIAGTGLGLFGLSPLIPAILFGTITFLMTLVGLQLGRMVSRLIPLRIRWDLVVGVVLVIEAVALMFGVMPGD